MRVRARIVEKRVETMERTMFNNSISLASSSATRARSCSVWESVPGPVEVDGDWSFAEDNAISFGNEEEKSDENERRERKQLGLKVQLELEREWGPEKDGRRTRKGKGKSA